MEIQFYIARGGEKVGPVTWEHLRNSAAKGDIYPSDLIWSTGQEAWRPAMEVPGLLTPPILNASGDTNGVEETPEIASGDVIAAPIELSSPVTAAVSTPTSQTKKPNFVIRHWRGDLILPVSYWVVNILGVVVLLGIGIGLGALQSDELDPHLSGALILAYWASAFSITIWQIVGTWRSASKHRARGGSAFWAGAAKVMIVLGILRFAGDFVANGSPMVGEAIHMVAGIDRIPPFALRTLRNGTELEISGGLSFGTADAVTKVIQATPTIKVIHLNSIGGRLTEANRLYKFIHDQGLITYVATECDSACTIAFMAGKKRYLGDQAKLGFHSSSIVGSNLSSDELNGSMRHAYQAANLDTAFIARALSTPSSTVWYPTVPELLAANAIDGVVDSRTYGLSGVVGWQSARDIEKTLEDSAPFAMLKKYDAASYQKMRDKFVEGVQDGKSEFEIQTELHAYLLKYLLPGYLQHAPDVPLLRYWKSQLAEARELQSANPQYCAQFFYPAPGDVAVNIQKIVNQKVLSEDVNALAGLIEGASLSPQTTTDNSLIEADLEVVVKKLQKIDARFLDTVANADKHKNDPVLTCNAIMTFYQMIIDLPQDRAANVLRYMVSQT